MECLNGCNSSWASQPETNALAGAGNLMIISAGEMAGTPFLKLTLSAFILNMKFIEKTTYYRLRGDYVFPTINLAWEKQQKELIDEILKNKRKLEIGVEGQGDSPGHCASYCTVTAMDVKTNKVLDVNVVYVKEVKNSLVMEKEGFVWAIDKIEQ